MKINMILYLYEDKNGNKKYILEIGNQSLKQNVLVDYECFSGQTIKDIYNEYDFYVLSNKSTSNKRYWPTYINLIDLNDYCLISIKEYKSIDDLKYDYLQELI